MAIVNVQKAVIYKATNTLNRKVYIGSDYSWTKRIIAHKTKSLNKADNYYFHNSLRKYGFDNFKWEILNERNHCSGFKCRELY